MHKRLLAALILASSMTTIGGMAHAEGPDWNGTYIGANVGFGGFGSSVDDLQPSGRVFGGGDLDVFGTGFLYGVQIGYNVQVDKVVYGIEADFSGATFDEKTATDGDDQFAEGSWNWYSTIRARLGTTRGNTLFYGTAGVAFVNAHFCGADDECITDGRRDLSFTETRVGYAVGAGAEVAVSSNWSLKAEYLFIDAGKATKGYNNSNPLDRIEYGTDAHLLRLGLNYKLGGFSGFSEAAPIFTPFSGFYAGVNIGFGGLGFNATDLDDDLFSAPGNENNAFGNAFNGGVQIGYNYAVDNMVYGIEADIQASGFDESSEQKVDGHFVSSEWNWFSTIRGRVGFTSGDTLFYGTAGLAIVDYSLCAFQNGPGCAVPTDPSTAAVSETKVGYTIGAGVETKLSDHWSLKGEYLYVDAGSTTVAYDVPNNEKLEFNNEAHIFRFGLNYAFN